MTKKPRKLTKQDTLKIEITNFLGNSWSTDGDKSKAILSKSLERIESLEKQLNVASGKDTSSMGSLFNNKIKNLEEMNEKLITEIKEFQSKFSKWKDLSLKPSFYLNENQKRFLKQF